MMLLPSSIRVIAVSVLHAAGKLPESALSARVSCMRRARTDQEAGRGPERMLLAPPAASSRVRAESVDQAAGSVDDTLFLKGEERAEFSSSFVLIYHLPPWPVHTFLSGLQLLLP